MTKDEELFNWLISLSEKDLREKILLPLFDKEGFHDIYEYHGSSEIGKDIIMWKQEGINERTDYAVIVKKTKISGKTTGGSTAAEVCFQIQQASGSIYPDPVTGRDRKATRFIVVTPFQNKPEAINAIKASLQAQRLESVTTFLHGTKLIKLFKKHFPNTGMLGSIKESHNELRKALSADKLLIESTDKETNIHILLKQDIDKSLLHGSFNFEYKDDKSKNDIRKAIEDFEKKGKPIEIEKRFIKDYSFPDILKPLASENLKLNKIVIEPYTFIKKPLNASIKIENESNYELSPLVFICTNAGTEEITFSNDLQILPIKIRLCFKLKEKTVDFSCDFNPPISTIDAFQLYKYEYFLYGLDLGGVINLIDTDNGLSFAMIEMPPAKKIGINLGLLKTLEKLSKIQIKINKPIFLSKSDISVEDVQSIDETYAALFDRRIQLKPGVLSISLVAEKAEIIRQMKAISDNKSHEFKLNASAEHKINFFNLTINLGIPNILIPNYQIKEDDLVEKEGTNGGCILKIKFNEEQKGFIEYQDNFEVF